MEFELVRWAQYGLLCLLFGVPATMVLLGARVPAERARRPILLLALASVPTTAAGFLLLVARMAGVDLHELDPALVAEVLTGSALGWAAIARMLGLVAALAMLMQRRTHFVWLLLPTVIAWGSLAWSGHAAASESMLGMIRLAVDVVHLLAASIWLGALAFFLFMLSQTGPAEPGARAPSRFSGLGSALVALLVATGIGNLLFLSGPRQWGALGLTPYGLLLITKIGLFCAMLGLAAGNRFVLVPRLLQAQAGAALDARRAMQISIALEMMLGAGVLGVVAVLGLLDPTGGAG